MEIKNKKTKVQGLQWESAPHRMMVAGVMQDLDWQIQAFHSHWTDVNGHFLEELRLGMTVGKEWKSGIHTLPHTLPKRF